MPIVNIKIMEGRTLEQKRQLIESVTEAISTSIGAPKEAVWIVIEDMKPENFAQAGVLRADKE